MKKRMLFLVAMLLLLVGCGSKEASTPLDSAALMRSPVLSQLPLQGVWEIDAIRQDASNVSNAKYAVKDKLYIDPAFVAINDQVTIAPTFTSKSVNMKDYADLRHISQDTGIAPEEDVQVHMIRDNDLFSMDLIFLGDDRIAFSDESRLYLLTRVNEIVPENTKNSYLELAHQSKSDVTTPRHQSHISTVIGVRTPTRSSSGYPYSTYQTYLIEDEPEQARPFVYMIDQLFLLDDDNNTRLLSYEPLEGDPNNQIMNGRYTYSAPYDETQESASVLNDALGREITFAQGNYVSFVRPSSYPPNADDMPQYEIMRLDALEREKALSVDDLGGEKEREAFHAQIHNQLEMIDPEGTVDAKKYPVDDQNIGIVRRNSTWSFVTTMNWAAGNNTFPSRIYVDLVTKIPAFQVPKEQIGWTRITNKVPLAVAAGISPSGERVFIQSEDELLYYNATKDAIEETARLSIQLGKGAQIVNLQYFYDDQAGDIRAKFVNLPQAHPEVIYYDLR
ncbi:MAG: hypothetical protein PUJ57_01580 [Peptoniphilaceae bacterium]|nr:hypothetical protein [Peptoniphilaceae bacterium]MDY6085987.1 hypothetical protein [Peptoniphilaceae bacterium]